jgi:hypothetical protein
MKLTFPSRAPRLLRRLGWLALPALALGFGWLMGRQQFAGSAQAAPAGAPPPITGATNDWLTGTPEANLATVSKHLRGFDVCMIEVGYRYAELYFAGQDRNWAFAEYQVDKIKLAIELALERRPKRAVSTKVFLADALPLVKDAVVKQDDVAFEQRFHQLTLACNTCHAMEQLGYMRVEKPRARPSVIRFAALPGLETAK